MGLLLFCFQVLADSVLRNHSGFAFYAYLCQKEFFYRDGN